MINGVVAVPLMAAMMVVVTRRHQMGRFVAPRGLQVAGWAATACMAAAVIMMLMLT